MMINVTEETNHGTLSAYFEDRCRCPECLAVFHRYDKEYKETIFDIDSAEMVDVEDLFYTEVQQSKRLN